MISPVPMANVRHFYGVATATMIAVMGRMKPGKCVLIWVAHLASFDVATSAVFRKRKCAIITKTVKTAPMKNRPSVRRKDFVYHISFDVEPVIASMDQWLVMDSTIAAMAVTNWIAVVRPSAALADVLNCALRKREVTTVAFALLAMQPCQPESVNRKRA